MGTKSSKGAWKGKTCKNDGAEGEESEVEGHADWNEEWPEDQQWPTEEGKWEDTGEQGVCQQCCVSTYGNGGIATSTEAISKKELELLKTQKDFVMGKTQKDFVLDYAIQLGLQQKRLRWLIFLWVSKMQAQRI